MESWTFREELAKPENPPRFGPAARAKGEPWVKNRISRCYFGPIKRPPLFHDELMDDVDYYPEPYLARLRREGVNGLWLTVEWRDLAETSFTTRPPDAERRLAKLRRTVDKCLKFGIKTWIFCLEPQACKEDDPLLRDHPEWFACAAWNDQRVMCPQLPEVQRYIEESVRDIFIRVPGLGGIMMISHGERATTCLSLVDPVTGAFSGSCPCCAKVAPWQIHWETASAIMRGIRAAGSSAEYISWMYHPQVPVARAPWCAEVARHLPEGVTLAYNFESGAEREQLGKIRHGGDYWLSFEGPAEGFLRVAEAGRSARAPIGAKIQVCNSHEVATVPYVPVPGLLYRKYRSMREMGVSTVLQCWYFGNYPGLMNEAAGLLSCEDFADGEDAFLERLAAPWWGPDAKCLAGLWKRYSDAYANYPLSNDMQYYGPFHAGVAWPLLPDVRLLPLGRTWKPHDPPSGDAIGECLENHTIEEAVELSRRMAEGMVVRDASGADMLDVLSARWEGDRDRLLDLGVMKALACQFASGYDIFTFYLERAKAIYESRVRGDSAAARTALDRMSAAVTREEEVTRRILPLAEADSRLGFHSEAEVHQYYPARLRWRLGELSRTQARIGEIRTEIEKGGVYPLSDHERSAASCRVGGDWTAAGEGVRFRVRGEESGDLTVELEEAHPKEIRLVTLDAAGVSWYKSVVVGEDGTVAPFRPGNAVPLEEHRVVRQSAERTDNGLKVRFTLSAAAWQGRAERRPGWLQLLDGFKPLWPESAGADIENARLNIFPLSSTLFGRLDWSREFSVADFGAKPDGTKCTVAFARAMAAAEAAGGGRIVVPPGKWTTGAIRFRSGCELHLAEGSEILFTQDPNDYLPAVHTSWEGMECWNYCPLVYAYCCTNVAITGTGTLRAYEGEWKDTFWYPWVWQDNGIRAARRQLYDWGATDYPVEKRQIWKMKNANTRPHFVQFNRCRGVRWEDFKVRNSPFWTLHLYLCDGAVAHGLDVVAHGNNNDGIDIEMSRNVLVENCRFDQGDDSFVIKSGRNRDAWRLGTPTENVEIRNCHLERAHTLLGVGSEISGGVRNVWMHDCTVGHANRLCYIKTNRRRGGFVENVRFEDVRAGSCDKVFAIETDVLYEWAKFPDYENRLTRIRDIAVRNVSCDKADIRVDIQGDPGLPIEDVRVDAVTVGAAARPDAVTNAVGVAFDGRPVGGTTGRDRR